MPALFYFAFRQPFRCLLMGMLLVSCLCSYTAAPAQTNTIYIEADNTGYSRYTKPDSLYLGLKEQYNQALKAGQSEAQGILLGQMGEICFHMGRYATALEYYLQATALLQQHQSANLLGYNYIDLGILYYYNRDTAEAVHSFNLALSLFEKHHDRKGIALSRGNMGFVMEKRKLYDSAIFYQRLALKEYGLSSDTNGMAKIYENIGSIHEDLEHYDSAMYYFSKSLDRYRQAGEKVQHLEVLNNIGDIYRKTGHYKEALHYSLQVIALSRASNELYQLSAGYRDVAKTYNLLGRNDSAYYYLEQSRKYLLDIYSRESAMQMAFLQAENDAQKKNNEIAELQHAHRINVIITVSIAVIILLLLVMGILIFNRQQMKINNERLQNEQNKRMLEAQNQLMDLELKSRILEEEKLKSQLTAQQLEREKLDTELRNKDLEEALLKDQIEVKTKELSTNALHVIQKNQLLEQLREQLETLVNDDKRDQKKAMKQLLSLINHNFNNDTYWEEFRNTFEQIHQSFFEQLTKLCPDLSASELRLVSLLKMNMSSNDMATMLGISTDSLRVARYRLRKKMNLSQGENLAAFLQHL